VDIIIFIAKVLASIFLVAFFIAGIFKANPHTHNPEIGPIAEYSTGFLICAASLVGIYFLWID